MGESRGQGFTRKQHSGASVTGACTQMLRWFNSAIVDVEPRSLTSGHTAVPGAVNAAQIHNGTGCCLWDKYECVVMLAVCRALQQQDSAASSSHEHSGSSRPHAQVRSDV